MDSVLNSKYSVLNVNMRGSRRNAASSPRPWAGALLRFCWQGVRAHIAEAATAAGYADLTRAHIALFRHPTLDGARPSRLASEVHLSKQAVNDLLGDLEKRGYIRREVDKADRRNRIIRLTRKGQKLESILSRAAQEADQMIKAQLGAQRFHTFRANLIQIAEFWETMPPPNPSEPRPNDHR